MTLAEVLQWATTIAAGIIGYFLSDLHGTVKTHGTLITDLRIAQAAEAQKHAATVARLDELKKGQDAISEDVRNLPGEIVALLSAKHGE